MSTAIIIINWNDYPNTHECLSSLRETHPHEDYTIILVDNHSEDGSRENIIEQYGLEVITPTSWNCEKQDIFERDVGFDSYRGGHVCLALNDNYGFTGANNFGMKFAWQQGFERILWLNNDTIVPPELLPRLHAGLDQYRDHILGCRIVFYPDTDYIWHIGGEMNWYGKPVSYHYKSPTRDVSYRERYIDSVFCSGCLMLYTRATLEKLGGQDNAYFFNIDDADYSYDARVKGISTKIDTETTLYHKSARSVAEKPGLAMYYGLRNLVYFRRKYFPWYRNIAVLCYVGIHLLGVLVVFTLRGYRPYRFAKMTLRDIVRGTMGKMSTAVSER